jgi:hypothetical protein
VEKGRLGKEGRKKERKNIKKEGKKERKECLSSSYAGHTVMWKLLA